MQFEGFTILCLSRSLINFKAITSYVPTQGLDVCPSEELKSRPNLHTVAK